LRVYVCECVCVSERECVWDLGRGHVERFIAILFQGFGFGG